ncbi:unnamed protein product [Caenorhabditis brenneri]
MSTNEQDAQEESDDQQEWDLKEIDDVKVKNKDLLFKITWLDESQSEEPFSSLGSLNHYHLQNFYEQEDNQKKLMNALHEVFRGEPDHQMEWVLQPKKGGSGSSTPLTKTVSSSTSRSNFSSGSVSKSGSPSNSENCGKRNEEAPSQEGYRMSPMTWRQLTNSKCNGTPKNDSSPKGYRSVDKKDSEATSLEKKELRVSDVSQKNAKNVKKAAENLDARNKNENKSAENNETSSHSKNDRKDSNVVKVKHITSENVNATQTSHSQHKKTEDTDSKNNYFKMPDMSQTNSGSVKKHRESLAAENQIEKKSAKSKETPSKFRLESNHGKDKRDSKKADIKEDRSKNIKIYHQSPENADALQRSHSQHKQTFEDIDSKRKHLKVSDYSSQTNSESTKKAAENFYARVKNEEKSAKNEETSSHVWFESNTGKDKRDSEKADIKKDGSKNTKIYHERSHSQHKQTFEDIDSKRKHLKVSDYSSRTNSESTKKAADSFYARNKNEEKSAKNEEKSYQDRSESKTRDDRSEPKEVDTMKKVSNDTNVDQKTSQNAHVPQQRHFQLKTISQTFDSNRRDIAGLAQKSYCSHIRPESSSHIRQESKKLGKPAESSDTIAARQTEVQIKTKYDQLLPNCAKTNDDTRKRVRESQGYLSQNEKASEGTPFKKRDFQISTPTYPTSSSHCSQKSPSELLPKSSSQGLLQRGVPSLSTETDSRNPRKRIRSEQNQDHTPGEVGPAPRKLINSSVLNEGMDFHPVEVEYEGPATWEELGPIRETTPIPDPILSEDLMREFNFYCDAVSAHFVIVDQKPFKSFPNGSLKELKQTTVLHKPREGKWSFHPQEEIHVYRHRAAQNPLVVSDDHWTCPESIEIYERNRAHRLMTPSNQKLEQKLWDEAEELFNQEETIRRAVDQRNLVKLKTLAEQIRDQIDPRTILWLNVEILLDETNRRLRVIDYINVVAARRTEAARLSDE